MNSENRHTSSRIGIRNWTTIVFVALPDCWSTVTVAPPAASSRGELLRLRAGGRVGGPQLLGAAGGRWSPSASRRGAAGAASPPRRSRSGRRPPCATSTRCRGRAAPRSRSAVLGELLHRAERHLRAGAARLDRPRAASRRRSPGRSRRAAGTARAGREGRSRRGARAKSPSAHQHRVAAVGEARADAAARARVPCRSAAPLPRRLRRRRLGSRRRRLRVVGGVSLGIVGHARLSSWRTRHADRGQRTRPAGRVPTARCDQRASVTRASCEKQSAFTKTTHRPRRPSGVFTPMTHKALTGEAARDPFTKTTHQANRARDTLRTPVSDSCLEQPAASNQPQPSALRRHAT